MSDGYQSLGFADADEFCAQRDYYSGIIKDYMQAKSLPGKEHIAMVFGISLGGHEHDDSIAYTRELCTDLMALLSNPAISSQLEPHLQPVAGRMLKQLFWLFQTVKEMDVAFDLIALEHDFPKSFTDDLDDKYRLLYKNAGMRLPDLPSIPVQLRKAS